MLLHWREDAETTLHSARVVVVDVALDHADQLPLAREALAVVPFTFEDAPEPLHRAIVDAVRHAGLLCVMPACSSL